MPTEIKPSEVYRHPDQPTLIYDINKPWEEVVANPPIWLGGFPEKPTEKKYILFGEPTISPMIIAAGPASGQRWTGFFLRMGYGAVIEKTRRSRERRSNPLHNIAIVLSRKPLSEKTIDKPRLGSLNPDDWKRFKSMTNSFGNPSSSIPTWTSEFRRQLTDVGDGQVLAVSVTATVDPFMKDYPGYFWDIEEPQSNAQYEEYIEKRWEAGWKIFREKRAWEKISEQDAEERKQGYKVAMRQLIAARQSEKIIADVMVGIAAAVGAGAEAVELNFACPNVTGNAIEGEMFQDGRLVHNTFDAAREMFPGIKLGLKVGRFNNLEQARSVIYEFYGNVDFVSTINALSVPIIALDGTPILIGRERAGTCGEILREISLRQVEMIAKLRDSANYDFEIHAGGGITEPAHVEQFKNAGGDGFFSGSAVLANPLLNNDYLYWLQEHQATRL